MKWLSIEEEMKMFDLSLIFLLLLGLFFSCTSRSKTEETTSIASTNYIRKIPGENDSIPEELVQKGKVLIAYSDCYTCHKLDTRAKGPAFADIAARYPVQEAYIDMLAHRIISGGSGAWGSPVMLPHPNLSLEDARIMVGYILSLKKGN